MAPRKEKAEKVSANEAAETILNYLRKQNRPYSATDISANLHNKVSKAAATKILKDLHDSSKIEGRAAGKQWIYHALQNADDILTPAQLSSLEANVSALRTQISTAIATAKTLRATLSSLNSTLSTSDLISSVKALEGEKAETEGRLDVLRAGKVKMMKKDREEVENEWKKWSSVMKRREKVVREMWALIEDVLPDREKREEVRESLGLDE